MKKFKLMSCLSIYILLLFSGKIFAQESRGGFPLSIINELKVDIPTVGLPTINNEAEIQIADTLGSNKCNTCKSNYYGKGIDEAIDIKNDGHLSIVSIGSDSIKLWLIQVESTTSYGMQFYFDKFKLPPGATLFFYNADTSTILGAYTSINNPADSTKPIPFGTRYIQGNKIIIEYSEPYNAMFEGDIHITKIIHIFKNIFDKDGPFGGAGSCEINVSCPLGNGWESEINSVGLILKYDASNGYSGWCSGVVLNNTNQDGTPYFLTANHCIDDNGTNDVGFDYSSWTILFNHQTSNCSSDGSDVSASTVESSFAPSLLYSDGQGSPTSDYLLLQLNTPPHDLATWGVCYAGWDRIEANGSNSFYTVGIHHPSGDVKKISKDDDYPCSSDYGQSCGTGNSHWRVQWDEQAIQSDPTNNRWGVTEAGSSGSPLFSVTHKVIGQLHGGSSLCNNTSGYDYYGKFSEDWTNSGSGNGFAFYLDPANSGATSVETYCPSGNYSTIGSSPGSSGDWCQVELGQGMVINGFETGIPEISSLPINLSPWPVCNNPSWLVQYDVETDVNCNDAPNTDFCVTDAPWFWNCDCMYDQHFIEIMQVDESLNFMQSTAHSKWFKYQGNYDGLETEFYTDFINVNQSEINGLNMNLVNGNLYRIKLAGLSYCWCEQSRIFRWTGPTIYSEIRCDGSDIIASTNSYDHAQNLQETYLGAGNSITTDGFSPVAGEKTWTAGNYIQLNDGASIDNEFYGYIYPCSENSGNRTIVSIDTSKGMQTSHVKLSDKKNGNPKSQSSLSKVNNGTVSDHINTAETFSIYPNPSTGRINIKLSDELIKSTVIIYDMLNKPIWQKSEINQTTFTIDLSSYNKGVYSIQFIKDGIIMVKKIVYI